MERGKHAIIVDFSKGGPMTHSATIRKAAASEVDARLSYFRSHLVAEARVVPNPLVRGALTAFDWMVSAKFSHPRRNMARYGEAELWISTNLAEAGMGIPEWGHLKAGA